MTLEKPADRRLPHAPHPDEAQIDYGHGSETPPAGSGGSLVKEGRRSAVARRGHGRGGHRVLRLHVYLVLGDLPLRAIRHSHARAFVTATSRRLAPNTARQVHAITRTDFRSAVADELIAETPFGKIALPKVQRGEVRAPSIGEVLAVAAAAPPRLRALVVLAAGSGLRSGEVLGLDVDRVDFLRRHVRVDRQLVHVSGRPPFLGPPDRPRACGRCLCQGSWSTSSPRTWPPSPAGPEG